MLTYRDRYKEFRRATNQTSSGVSSSKNATSDAPVIEINPGPNGVELPKTSTDLSENEIGIPGIVVENRIPSIPKVGGSVTEYRKILPRPTNMVRKNEYPGQPPVKPKPKPKPITVADKPALPVTAPLVGSAVFDDFLEDEFI